MLTLLVHIILVNRHIGGNCNGKQEEMMMLIERGKVVKQLPPRLSANIN